MTTTRTFTRDELNDLEVPWEGMLQEEFTHSSRWANHYTGVFAHDGQHWQVAWQVEATELTDCDTWGDRREIVATRVELRDVTVQRWVPVEADGTVAA